MNKIVNYSIGDLDLFNLEDDLLKNIENLKLSTKNSDEAKTIIVDGRPIIATGLILLNNSTGSIWLIKTKYINENKFYIIRVLKDFIIEYVKKYNLKRLQTTITDENIKWIELLGFERESELVNFCPDKKIYLYRRLF